MTIKPQERLLLVVPIDDETKTKNFIVTTESVEDYFKYKVVAIGEEVNTEYVLPGDEVIAQKKDVNVIKYKDETYYLVSQGYVIKVEL